MPTATKLNEARFERETNFRDPNSVKAVAQALGLSNTDLFLAVQTAGDWPGAVEYLLRRASQSEVRV